MEKNLPVIKNRLLVCMTPGMSLAEWQRNGILEREIAVYHEYVRNGWRVDFASFNPEADIQLIKDFEGFEIVSCWHRWLLFLAPVFLASAINRANVVKTNQSWRSWWYVMAARLQRRPVVLRCGWLPLRKMSRTGLKGLRWRIYGLLEGMAFRFATWIQVATESDKAWLIQNYAVRDGRIEIVPNFVDVDIFRPKHLEKYSCSICFVGRLNEQKNLDMLLRAAAIAKSEKVLFIGNGHLEVGLRQLATDLGIHLEIIPCVVHSELPEIISRYQVFAMVSSFEGHPKALLEAMACELACLGSDTDGIRALIKQGETGMLCKLESTEIAEALTKLFRSEDLRIRLGRQAREAIISSFSKTIILEKEINKVTRMAR